MTYLRYVARRAAFALAAAYAVVTLTYVFGAVVVASDLRTGLAHAQWQGADPADLARLERSLTSTFGLDEPFLDRLVGWWIDVATLDWGYSSAFDEPVIAVLDGAVLTTLEYVVPGVVLATVLGVLAGLYAALHADGAFDWASRLSAYALLGVPAFVVASYGLFLSGYDLRLLGDLSLVLPALDDKTVAMLAVAAGLLVAQLRFARAATLEQTGRSFVKLLRAKGAGRVRLARHVLRNAAIPIASMSVTELLAVLVLNIYVIERAIDIPGLALVSLRAIGVVEWGGYASPPVISDVSLLVWSVCSSASA